VGVGKVLKGKEGENAWNEAVPLIEPEEGGEGGGETVAS
jgi:hypothetical protein